MLGKVSEGVPPVVDKGCNRIIAIAAFNHAPIDPDFVQGVAQTSCGKPIVEGAAPALSPFPVQDERSGAVREKCAASSTLAQVPPRSS